MKTTNAHPNWTLVAAGQFIVRESGRLGILIHTYTYVDWDPVYHLLKYWQHVGKPAVNLPIEGGKIRLESLPTADLIGILNIYSNGVQLKLEITGNLSHPSVKLFSPDALGVGFLSELLLGL